MNDGSADAVTGRRPTPSGENVGELTRQRPRLLRVLLMIVATAGSVFVLSGVWEFACNPIGVGGNCMPWVPQEPFAENTLLGAGPNGFDLPMDRYTADYLNQTHPGEEWTIGKVRYVDADTASAGPTVVSVNPVDRYTWGAATYDTRRRRCYLIRWGSDRRNPEYGGARFDVLTPGERCVGSAITATRPMAGDWPSTHVRRTDWITEGAAILAVGLALTLASHAIALRASNRLRGARRAARGVLFGAGIVAIVMGLVPLLEGL